MVRLQRLTGMRPGEVVLMRAVDIDMGDPACWAYRPARHKGQHRGRERVVFLGPAGPGAAAAVPDARPDGLPVQPAAVGGAVAGRGAGPAEVAPDALAGGAAAEAESRADARASCTTTGPTARRSARRARRPASRSGSRTSCGMRRPARFRRRYGLEASQAVLGHSRAGDHADLRRGRPCDGPAGHGRDRLTWAPRGDRPLESNPGQSADHRRARPDRPSHLAAGWGGRPDFQGAP